MPGNDDITRLLEAHAAGREEALDALLPLVYEQLRRIAHGRMRGERDDHTLNTTALVHEAYIRLADLDHMVWQNRSHFFAVASRAMRRVLIDYAIRRNAQKRGGKQQPVALDDLQVGQETDIEDLVALDQALDQLETFDARQARIVECRFFGGMTIEETAEALQVSPGTVSRDWSMARAFLARALSGGASA